MSAHDEAIEKALEVADTIWLDVDPSDVARVVRAYLAALAKEGLRVTPRAPTKAMKEAVRLNGGTEGVAWLLAAWPDAHDAAPSPEEAP